MFFLIFCCNANNYETRKFVSKVSAYIVKLEKNSSKEEASSSEEKGYTMTRGLYNEANEIFHNGRLA